MTPLSQIVSPAPVDAPGVSVSLLLPVWNEAGSIARTVAGVDEALARIVPAFEILIIDDGGRDGSSAVAQALAAKNPAVRLVHHEPNRGYGAALKSGFLAATCDLVLFADAAGQCDVVRLDRLALLSRAYDIVCGGGVARRQPPMRTAYFKLFNRLQAALSATDLRDASRGLKLFHRESLLNLTPVAVDLGASATRRQILQQQAG